MPTTAEAPEAVGGVEWEVEGGGSGAGTPPPVASFSTGSGERREVFKLC